MGEESTQAIEVKRTLTLGPSLSGFLTQLHPHGHGLIFFMDRIMIIMTSIYFAVLATVKVKGNRWTNNLAHYTP